MKKKEEEDVRKIKNMLLVKIKLMKMQKRHYKDALMASRSLRSIDRKCRNY
jgi:hypothetical protein